MIHMVEETLHENAPDERFSVKVIESLLARPKLLEIEGHPVRQVWEAMRAALPDYDVVHGEEIEDSEAFAAAEDHAWDGAYRLGKDQALRYQTTTVTLAAIRGRTAPVRLLAPGRVFRPEREDAGHMKVFHQVDGVCVDAGADMAGFKATCERTVKAAVPGAEIIRREHDYGLVSLGAEAVIVQGEARYEVLGGGMLRAETLDNAGYDPGAVSGFAWGLSLERLAMLRFDIDDIRKLWAPPYVPGR
jgi:phenylalanyl-tRNA synthetase alpha chain